MDTIALIWPKIDHSHFGKTILFIVCHRAENSGLFQQVIVLLTQWLLLHTWYSQMCKLKLDKQTICAKKKAKMFVFFLQVPTTVK